MTNDERYSEMEKYIDAYIFGEDGIPRCSIGNIARLVAMADHVDGIKIPVQKRNCVSTLALKALTFFGQSLALVFVTPHTRSFGLTKCPLKHLYQIPNVYSQRGQLQQHCTADTQL
jgi:hypothetical protein